MKNAADLQFGVLASLIMRGAEAFDELAVNETHFPDLGSKQVFHDLAARVKANKPIDQFSLVSEGIISQAFCDRMTQFPTSFMLNSYAAPLIEHKRKRDAWAVFSTAAEDLKRGEDTDATCAKAEADIFAIVDAGHVQSEDAQSDAKFSDYVDAVISKTKEVGFSTCLKTLDTRMGGFRKRFMYVIGARQKIGKTSWALQAMMRAWEDGASVLFLSLDMGWQENRSKAICAHLNINPFDFICGNVTQAEADRIKAFSDKLTASKRWHLVELTNPSSDEIASYVRRHKRKYGCDMVVVDFYQRIGPKRGQTDQREILRVASGDLKMIARNCDVSMLVLAQLNRFADQGQPRTQHIADCDDLSRDADCIMLVWIEQDISTLGASEPVTHKICIDRQRWGASGVTIEAVFDRAFTKYATDDQKLVAEAPRQYKDAELPLAGDEAAPF